MGLLDNYLDPETMAALKQMNQPDEAQKKQALNNAMMQAGFAMLANNGLGANRRQSLGQAIGAGGQAGMGAYQGTLDEARQQNQAQFQQSLAMGKLVEELKARQRQQEALARETPEVQQMVAAGMPYKDIMAEKIKGYTLGQGDQRMVGDKVVASVAPKAELKEGYIVGDGKGGWSIDKTLYDANIAARRAGATNVNVSQPYEPQFNKELAGLDAKSLDGMRSKAEAGQSMLGTLARMRSLNSGIYSNGTAEAKLATANMLAGLGVNVGDPTKLAQSQEFDALATKLTMDSLGGSLGPGVSNSDVQFIKKTVPQLGHSAEARESLYNFLEKKAKNQIDTYGSARGYAEKNNGLKGWTAPTSEDQPLPKSKFFKVDGANVAGVLGADGKYYVEKNGKKYRVEE